MSDILSQAEIESLLSSLASGEEVNPLTPDAGSFGSSYRPSGHAPKAAIAFEVYDFRRPDKFSKEQLRTLQMLHETFGRLSATSLSAMLRTPVAIELISLEQVPYEEYLRSINSSVFTILSLPPLNGQAVMEIEFPLVFTMIDKLLGGPGKAINRGMLTDIEYPLVRGIMDRMFTGLKSAWEGVVIVNPGVEGLETSAQFVQIAPPNDIVVSILFEMTIGDVQGAMSLCIPYMVLKPITTKLSAQKWFATTSRRGQAAVRKQIAQHLQEAPVSCKFELGRCPLTIRDFLRLRPGDVVRLDQKTDRDLRMIVGNRPKFFVRPALDGHRLVFSVTHAYE